MTSTRTTPTISAVPENQVELIDASTVRVALKTLGHECEGVCHPEVLRGDVFFVVLRLGAVTWFTRLLVLDVQHLTPEVLQRIQAVNDCARSDDIHVLPRRARLSLTHLPEGAGAGA
jgi:hypothetical protein